MSGNEQPVVQLKVQANRLNSVALSQALGQLQITSVLVAVCGAILALFTVVTGITTAQDALATLFGVLLCITGINSTMGVRVLHRAIEQALVVAEDDDNNKAMQQATEPKKTK